MGSLIKLAWSGFLFSLSGASVWIGWWTEWWRGIMISTSRTSRRGSSLCFFLLCWKNSGTASTSGRWQPCSSPNIRTSFWYATQCVFIVCLHLKEACIKGIFIVPVHFYPTVIQSVWAKAWHHPFKPEGKAQFLCVSITSCFAVELLKTQLGDYTSQD